MKDVAEKINRNASGSGTAGGVKASIIVPTRNRADVLGDCLASLARQTVFPDVYEILVVDNGSTDGTAEVIENFVRKHPHNNIRTFHELIPGLLSGRHRGAQEARAPILVYVDDDSVAAPDWLKAILETFTDSRVHLVGGPSRGIFCARPPHWMAAFLEQDKRGTFNNLLSLQDMGQAIIRIPPRRVWGLNFSIRRSTLFELGGFHPDCIPSSLQRFQGDGETGLSDKIGHAGYYVIYHPRAAVGHIITPDRLTMEYIERRAYYQGVCDSYTEIRDMGTTDGVVPPAVPAEPLRSTFKSQQNYECAMARHRFMVEVAKGYAFHLEEVRRDPALLAWVLRDDYLSGWDYQALRAPEVPTASGCAA